MQRPNCITLSLNSISDVSIGFNPSSYTVLEGDSEDLIIVRVGDAEVPVVATISTVDGTATGIYLLTLLHCIIIY